MNKHEKDLKEFAIEKSTTPLDSEDQLKQTNVTSCKSCVFSIRDEEGFRQTGCKIGRIEKYRKKGIPIIEARDEEGEFYGLETWCNAYREEPWKIAHKEEDLPAVARLESAPNVSFIILVKDTIDNLEKTIESILNQDKIKACRIVIVHMGKEAKVDYLDLIEKCKDLLEGQIDYKVQNIMPNLSQLEAIDAAFINLLNGYYSVFECGKEAPRDLIDTIHANLYDKLKNIGLIRGYDGVNGLTSQCVLHKFLYGNRGASLETKIKEGEEHDKIISKNSLIHTWDELR